MWLPAPQSEAKWLKSEVTQNDSEMGSGVTLESILNLSGVGLSESLLGHF